MPKVDVSGAFGSATQPAFSSGERIRRIARDVNVDVVLVVGIRDDRMRVRTAAGLHAGHLSGLQRISDVEDPDAVHAVRVGGSRAASTAGSASGRGLCRLIRCACCRGRRPCGRRRRTAASTRRPRCAIQPAIALDGHEREVAPRSRHPPARLGRPRSSAASLSPGPRRCKKSTRGSCPGAPACRSSQRRGRSSRSRGCGRVAFGSNMPSGWRMLDTSFMFIAASPALYLPGVRPSRLSGMWQGVPPPRPPPRPRPAACGRESVRRLPLEPRQSARACTAAESESVRRGAPAAAGAAAAAGGVAGFCANTVATAKLAAAVTMSRR